MGEFLTYAEKKELLKKYVNEMGLMRMQIESYNYFVKKGIWNIISSYTLPPSETGLEVPIPGIRGDIPVLDEEYSDDETKKHSPKQYCFLLFEPADTEEKVIFEVPPTKSQFPSTMPVHISPIEAKHFEYSYHAPLKILVRRVFAPLGGEHSSYFRKEYSQPEKLLIAKLPVMVGSDYCITSKRFKEKNYKIFPPHDELDPGGYFILNGNEKVIVAIEDLAPNRVTIEPGAKNTIKYTAKIFSKSQNFQHAIALHLMNNGELKLEFGPQSQQIPVFVAFYALGLTRDNEIISLITSDKSIVEELVVSSLTSGDVSNQESALDFIGRKVSPSEVIEERIKRGAEIIDNYLFPHIGNTPESRREKIHFLAYMVRKLFLTVNGIIPMEEKDHMANKRISLSGKILERVFSMAFSEAIKEAKRQLDRASPKRRQVDLNIHGQISSTISDALTRLLSIGETKTGTTGLSQVFERVNYVDSVCHLRRVNSPLSKTQSSSPEPRLIHASQWGRICPNESPEGINCGLVKNLALQATVTIDEVPFEIIRELLRELKDEDGTNFVIPLEKATTPDIIILVEGRVLGYTRKPEKFVESVKKLRRSGRLPYSINVAYLPWIQEVHINTGPGRVQRPLLVVKDGKPLLTREIFAKAMSDKWSFREFIEKGYIELLDAEEEESAYIAVDEKSLTKEHTHMEIDPYGILGISAGLIPYIEHNQSPRNTYGAAMMKQGLGFQTSVFRYDPATQFYMVYPQKPIVRTKVMDLIPVDNRPYGSNFVVAVLSYQGYNIEDAIIMNKSAIERGLSRAYLYNVFKAKEEQYIKINKSDKICIPSKDVRHHKGEEAYSALEEDGLPLPEREIEGGKVVIGKVSPPRFTERYDIEAASELKDRDTSILIHEHEAGIVDWVLLLNSEDNTKLASVRIRKLLIPELGDKYASRHGQKGVIGMLFPQELMPFTESGIVPDLIINPHAFPSRMTMGQLLESIAGKVGALEGRFIDGTPFHGEKDFEDALRRLGFRYDGTEVFYDPVSGKRMIGKVFVGVVYYMRLKHLVSQKIHARATGPVQMLTRQPTEGKAREGGLRLGEMEKDC
ncbi:MAG: DNA-directed RNA polymerase subunit B, partial [Candidatus Korarchaeota archaeon]